MHVIGSTDQGVLIDIAYLVMLSSCTHHTNHIAGPQTTEPFLVDNFSFLILFCQEIKTNMKHLIPIDLVNE